MAQPTTTTMDSLKDDNVEDILLRLPSWASLGHAVRASDRFCRITSDPDFLRRFRARHASSSPRSFLGVFARRHPLALGLPFFHLAGPARSDPGLVAVARTGDFLLAGLEDDDMWCIDDCRNGRILLSKGRSLTIYEPITLRRTDISHPQDDSFLVSCFLDDGDSSFRVFSLQKDCHLRLRVVVYDSTLHEWRHHPWAADAIAPHPPYHTTYAAGLIFLDHNGSTGTSSIMLDTRTMKFSMLPLPATIATANSRITRYTIGDTEDGKCCLVCLRNDLLQVWLLRENRRGSSNWEFEKEKPLSELLHGHYYDGRLSVEEVVAGLVIVWAGDKIHHYAIDLKNLSFKAELFDGETVVYPFQLPWPPAGLTPGKRRMLQIDIRKDTEKKQRASPRRSKRLCQRKKQIQALQG